MSERGIVVRARGIVVVRNGRRVVDDVDVDVDAGRILGVTGPSGSGKSTLLAVLAGLIAPDAGTVDPADRSGRTGIVLQGYGLLPVLTAFENVELPLLLTQLGRKERKRLVSTALDLVGLAERMHHLPKQMSGGQEQRVAIARALVNDPSLIVADEPTGDLDGRKKEEILDLLQTLQEGLKKTILMVTHDHVAALRAHRLLRIDDGHLVEGTSQSLAEAFPEAQRRLEESVAAPV